MAEIRHSNNQNFLAAQVVEVIIASFCSFMQYRPLREPKPAARGFTVSDERVALESFGGIEPPHPASAGLSLPIERCV